MQTIELSPYPVHMAIVFTKEDHELLCASHELPPFGSWYEDTHRQPHATTFTFARESHPYRLVVVEFYCVDNLKFNTISHEAVHVMSSLMKYVGLVYDVDNDEWYAYMHDFIVNTICKADDDYEAKLKAPTRIDTGNHPVVNVAPLTDAEKAERYAKVQLMAPTFTIDALNNSSTDFMDDK